MSKPIPGKLPGVPSGGGGEAGSRNFPTCLSTLPISLYSSAGPSPPLSTGAAGPALDTGRPAAAPGRRELPAGKVSNSAARFPTPGPGLGARPAPRSAAASPPAPGAATAPAAATANAALRPVPPPRTAHTRASLAARIPALARVPEGTFLSRACPGRASRAPPRPGLRRLPGPTGAQRANLPPGAGAAPLRPTSPGQVSSAPQGGLIS